MHMIGALDSCDVITVFLLCSSMQHKWVPTNCKENLTKCCGGDLRWIIKGVMLVFQNTRFCIKIKNRNVFVWEHRPGEPLGSEKGFI